MLRSGSRVLPKLRSLLFKGNHQGKYGVTTVTVKRQFNLPSRNDPFSQMETFIRDMERKFWREVDYNFPWTSRLPQMAEATVVETTRLGGPSDESTSDKFKLVFNFPNSKPEDIKVTLKDRLLIIEGKSEQTTSSSKWSQSFAFEYTIPEGAIVESLESLFSNDGVLTIQAPLNKESVQSIPINRE